MLGLPAFLNKYHVETFFTQSIENKRFVKCFKSGVLIILSNIPCDGPKPPNFAN
jgi:hypothetical protein